MSREACTALLAAKDRSALVLSKYIPAYASDGWLAMRALNVETAKVVDGAREPTASLARMQYWKAGIQRAYTQGAQAAPSTQSAPSAHEGEAHEAPLALLTHSLRNGVNIPKRYLLTLIQTREYQLGQPPVRNSEDLARVGEGTASQLLYATLDMLQSREQGTAEFLAAHPELDEHVSNILAHIGQAQGIAGALNALPFYAMRHNRLLLPLDAMSKYKVSEQEVLNVLTNSSSNKKAAPPNLKDAVFEVATSANDHILAARMLIQQFKEQTGGKTPQSLTLSTMGALPTVLFLERLQKNDFDVLKPQAAEWRLPWRTWRSYRTKTI